MISSSNVRKKETKILPSSAVDIILNFLHETSVQDVKETGPVLRVFYCVMYAGNKKSRAFQVPFFSQICSNLPLQSRSRFDP
jgi:hypothetical protein